MVRLQKSIVLRLRGMKGGTGRNDAHTHQPAKHSLQGKYIEASVAEHCSNGTIWKEGKGRKKDGKKEKKLYCTHFLLIYIVTNTSQTCDQKFNKQVINYATQISKICSLNIIFYFEDWVYFFSCNRPIGLNQWTVAVNVKGVGHCKIATSPTQPRFWSSFLWLSSSRCKKVAQNIVSMQSPSIVLKWWWQDLLCTCSAIHRASKLHWLRSPECCWHVMLMSLCVAEGRSVWNWCLLSVTHCSNTGCSPAGDDDEEAAYTIKCWK